MPTSLITVYARGGVRTLAEITVGLAHRRSDLRTLVSSFADGRCRVDLVVDAPSDRTTDLMVERLHRIVNVTEVHVQAPQTLPSAPT
jgi:acetolactate synthase regulatory subunit